MLALPVPIGTVQKDMAAVPIALIRAAVILPATLLILFFPNLNR